VNSTSAACCPLPENMVPRDFQPKRDPNLEAAILKLAAYCRANDWAGYDPYDALNSRLFDAVPFLNSRFPRLILTQILKRSPVNLRPVAGVPKTQNPKAIALFLSAFLKLSRIAMPGAEATAELMLERLEALRSRDDRYCWGYSFPWQGRAVLVPAGAPNLVCTTFVANSLLNAYEQRRDARCLQMALSAAGYILQDLYWTDGDRCGFAYPLPSVRADVHNANFLASALLCRAYKHTGERRFLDPALRVARYSTGRQRADGSWFYGETSSAQWIDNFHTGYNLCALQSIRDSAETTEFDSAIRRGLEFYRAHFFRQDGAPRYFHDRTYPLDIHCVAQSIITLVAFQSQDEKSVPLARKVLGWAMQHMWDEKGYFYYRVLRSGTIRTSYMRWSQAWMLLALSTLLCDVEPAAEHARITTTSVEA
jgi:hypothetical protein